MAEATKAAQAAAPRTFLGAAFLVATFFGDTGFLAAVGLATGLAAGAGACGRERRGSG
jgi:hypothetical protein